MWTGAVTGDICKQNFSLKCDEDLTNEVLTNNVVISVKFEFPSCLGDPGLVSDVGLQFLKKNIVFVFSFCLSKKI